MAICKDPDEVAEKPIPGCPQKGSRSVVAAVGSGEWFPCGSTNTPRPSAALKKARQTSSLNSLPILRTLGEAYLMDGQLKKAKHVLEAALELDHG